MSQAAKVINGAVGDKAVKILFLVRSEDKMFFWCSESHTKHV